MITSPSPIIGPLNAERKRTGDSGSWTVKTSGTTGGFYSIDYNNGLWVACGDSGIIFTSDDGGESWTSRTSGTTKSLRTVKWWNGNWWIVGWGDATTHTVLKSSDGITWSPVTISGLSGAFLVEIDFTDTHMMFGGWVAPFAVDSGLIITTADGSTFDVNLHTAYAGVYSIANNGEFVLISGSDAVDDTVDFIATSTDWGDTVNDITSIGSAFTWAMYASDHNSSRWVLGDGNGNIKYSPDNLGSLIASSVPVIAGFYPWRITHDEFGNIMIGAGSTANGKILRSIDDGISFQEVYSTATTNFIAKVVRGPGYWIGVGFQGVIVKSSS